MNIITQIDNVRIIRRDDLNFVVEREETTENFNPKLRKKVKNTSYRFKGYYGTIAGALKAIHRNGLLIDENSCSELEDALEQIKMSERKVVEAVERLREGGK